MDDLISKQAALDIIDAELTGWLTDDERLRFEGVAIAIECLPRIDAVPVVRCKDCEHYDESGWGFGECHLERWGDGWANYPPPSVSEDGFCKWAKRSEECD